MFIWDGSRLVQEYNYKGTYTYIYTDQDSYEPLAHVFYNNKDEKLYLSYYHTDQIGIPREQTDQFGNLLWTGEYDAWGSLQREEKIYPNAHQPFRLQNQYYDQETGLHYNFLRYYDPNCGRFVNQDPIGLLGGEHLYSFAPNSQMWVDPLGLSKSKCPKPCIDGGSFKDMNNKRKILKKKNKRKEKRLVGNHVPQNAFLKTQGISRNDGPAILMTNEAHALTRTFAGKGKQSMRLDAASNLDFKDRLLKDIEDIRNLFGDACEDAIAKVIAYAKQKNFI